MTDQSNTVYKIFPVDEARPLDMSFVRDHLEAKKIVAEIKPLNAERKEICDAPPTLDKLKETITASHAELRERQITGAVNFLRRVQKSKNPLAAAERAFHSEPSMQRIFAPIDLDLLLTACDRLQEPGALSEADREKALAAVEKKIKALEAKLSGVSPEKYFSFRNGVVEHDKREVFVSKWQDTQAMCNQPVGPHGVALKHYPAAVQKAHRALGIDQHINPVSGRLPSGNVELVEQEAAKK